MLPLVPLRRVVTPRRLSSDFEISATFTSSMTCIGARSFSMLITTGPATFASCCALRVSPTVMWSGGRLFQEWRAHTKRWSRIYLDAGSNEHIDVAGKALDYGNCTRDFFIHLKKLGYADHEVCLVLEPGGVHNELDWQRRLPFAFRWLLS